jgi:4-aminobutyrate--pyruvate transaminase
MDLPARSAITRTVDTSRGPVLYPFADPLSVSPPVVMIGGEGSRIWDINGRAYLDATAGFVGASLGYGNERLARAGYEQLQRLSFCQASQDKTHLPLIELAQRLVSLAPMQAAKVFFASSGSEANDTAVKLVWYYHNAIGRPQKKKIISRFHGQHGVTLAASSLTGESLSHHSFDVPLPGFLRVQSPHHYRNGRPGETEERYAQRCADELQSLILAEGPDTIAAMFVEPIMACGGVIVPPPTYYPQIQQVLERHEVLLVADEVICGFGRTGSYWGSQAMEMRPDIMTCGQGLSAAHQPMNAVLISPSIAQVVERMAHSVGLFCHGSSAFGHPVGAAVALEALRIYDELDIQSRARQLGLVMQTELRRRFAHLQFVGEIRGMGLLAGMELVAGKERRLSFADGHRVAEQLAKLCARRGLLVHPCSSNTVALSPPLTIKVSEVTEILDILEASYSELEPSLHELARESVSVGFTA